MKQHLPRQRTEHHQLRTERENESSLQEVKESFPLYTERRSTEEGMNPLSVTTTWDPARGTGGCCTGPRCSTITITTPNTHTNGGRKPTGGGTLIT